MNSRKKLHLKLLAIKENIEILLDGLDFRYEEKAREDVKKIIKLCNQAYPLMGFVDYTFQKDFYVNFRQYEHRYYIKVGGVNYLKTAIGILDALVNKLEAEEEYADLLPTQIYYTKNQKLSLLEDFDQIFKTAKESILYYDIYMDHILVSVLQDVQVQEIKLLSSNNSEKFKTWLHSFNSQYSKNITHKLIKEKNVHDRYCVLDNSEVWQIGGSINIKTMNSVTLTKISDEDTKNKIISDLEKIWEEGS